MTISYFSLGPDKRLCDVVFAGSHDAGVNKGGPPTKAQSDPIAVQAEHGARFFDVRVGAFMDGHKIKLKAFHAAEMLQVNTTKDLKISNRPGLTSIETMSLPIGGHSGEKLAAILSGAREFVERRGEEFLVLIFSKSTNMSLVVEKVDEALGTRQYAEHGNLNTRTLQELQGRVICVYTEEDVLGLKLDSYARHARANGPRYGIRNLFKGGTYEEDSYNGIQYFGKGGLTDSVSNQKDKVNMNAGLQLEKMKAGAQMRGHQTMLGMVYVTATGGLVSLRERDKKLWKDKRVSPLLNIWENEEVTGNIMDRMPSNIDPSSQSSAPVIKNFFPNMVMMDFTSRNRCQAIFDINIQSTGLMGEQTTKRTISRPRPNQANQNNQNNQNNQTI